MYPLLLKRSSRSSTHLSVSVPSVYTSIRHRMARRWSTPFRTAFAPSCCAESGSPTFSSPETTRPALEPELAAERRTSFDRVLIPLTNTDSNHMAKILCVLYDDPITGYPPRYARDALPAIESYPDGQTTPNPKQIDFTPGELLGCVSGGLGLRKYLESLGHTFVVTSDKEGPNSVFDRELPDAQIVISQPFWPAYLTAERIARAKKLKLAITAGIGSDHVDLEAASRAGITVAEETFSNSISVAEHAVMMILSLVRNYLPSHEIAKQGGWNIADCVSRSYDLEGMHVGTVAAGRIGVAVLRRLKPFGVKLHYTAPHRISKELEEELGVTFHATADEMVRVCDVISIHAPLYPGTAHLFNKTMLSKMKRGS